MFSDVNYTFPLLSAHSFRQKIRRCAQMGTSVILRDSQRACIYANDLMYKKLMPKIGHHPTKAFRKEMPHCGAFDERN